ncbi:putative alkyl hydroperoxide reductase [Actinacidiphila reveromycinica]|uniref:thioredoxin-dependent peroxiredoxin n=1 Tax=Actinacidiphila reveromycinica TaxID=659352 RepID=A0A7U3UV68_9ACTN|nr:peroxiredoxin [Streptomyces sp. SN-593]BBA99467.1 putative alkyl hydroperoxide reductase [Streptomyces sp. SN-593]
MTLQVGDKAPDFTLPDQSGAEVRLSERLRHKTVVLYFYPKDNTRGCTAEACSFRDGYESFTDAGAEVIGVSSDTVASHEKFAGRYELPFTLLSDRDRAVRRQYGATTLGVVPGRITFVIDQGGTIRHAFSSMMNVGAHVDDALAVVKKVQEEAAGAAAAGAGGEGPTSAEEAAGGDGGEAGSTR